MNLIKDLKNELELYEYLESNYYELRLTEDEDHDIRSKIKVLEDIFSVLNVRVSNVNF